MQKDLTCIVCPMGCRMTVTSENGKFVSVTGNTCPRGAKYAEAEYTNPMRTITSTVRCSDGRMVSVKTDRTIPKANIADCMKIINSCTAHPPISIGDIITENVFGSNIVATENII